MKNSGTAVVDKAQIVKPETGASKELRDFFIDSLKDIYWAENALVSTLPKMAVNATSPGVPLS